MSIVIVIVIVVVLVIIIATLYTAFSLFAIAIANGIYIPNPNAEPERTGQQSAIRVNDGPACQTACRRISRPSAIMHDAVGADSYADSGGVHLVCACRRIIKNYSDKSPLICSDVDKGRDGAF